MQVVSAVLKFALIWLALYAGQVVGGIVSGMILHPRMPPMLKDGPLGLADGMAVVTAAFALVMALMAVRLRGGYWRRAGVLFALLYGVGTLLSLVEAVWFNAYLKLSTPLLIMIPLGNLVQALAGCLVASALWPGAEAMPERFSGLGWKLIVLIPIYIAFYFGAGALIAWQGAAVRAYYQQGLYIDHLQLAVLQIGRGLAWGVLACIGVRGLTGPAWQRAILVGLAFAVFMAVQLLLPSFFMPWAVRKMHLIEVFSSNLLFGILASAILMAGMKARTE